MELKSQQKVLGLLLRMSGKKDKPVGCIPFVPQKTTPVSMSPIEQPFERATPESQGVDSALLADFIREISDRRDLGVHSVMILRNSRVIAECSMYPYDRGIWHVTHSLAKSITGIAVGMLIDEGRLSLDTLVTDVFAGQVPSMFTLRKKELRVRHLLTMSSGVSFSEAGAVTDDNYVKAYLESGMVFKPGEKFMYNSMNSYMLSAIIQKLTGVTMFDYLKERLFAPLGITNVFWESCPMGITKGGWGLYIILEDVAKISQLLLNKGVWNGKRLLSESYIEEATRAQIRSDRGMNDYGYGYHIWISKRSGSYQFNGMLGQNSYIIPDLNIVIVINAGNGELFPKSNMTSIVESYFGDGYRPKSRLPLGIISRKKLTTLIDLFEEPRSRQLPPAEQCRLLDGSVYKTDRGGSVLPVFIQAMQNNHSMGISRIGFELKGDELHMLVTESDQKFDIPVGFGRYIQSTLDFGGEKYTVRTLGAFAADEDDTPVLKIFMPFIETASTRRIKIFFYGDSITVKFFEDPGLNLAMDGLGVIVNTGAGGGGHLLFSLLSKASDIEPEYLSYRASKTMMPVITGKKIKA